MDTKKMILLLMIFSFLGIFALPVTMSLFAGQHSWYDLGAEGNQVPCVKCHADVADELDAGGHHKSLYSSGDVNEACDACHRGNSSITYAEGTEGAAIPGEGTHAASTITCGYCHFNSSNPTGAPVAGGFGHSDLLNDTGMNASHYSFVVQSRAGNMLQDESESCVACHTTTNITINFNVTTGMTVNVNNAIISDSSAYWNITSVAPSNYTTYMEEK